MTEERDQTTVEQWSVTDYCHQWNTVGQKNNPQMHIARCCWFAVSPQLQLLSCVRPPREAIKLWDVQREGNDETWGVTDVTSRHSWAQPRL